MNDKAKNGKNNGKDAAQAPKSPAQGNAQPKNNGKDAKK